MTETVEKYQREKEWVVHLKPGVRGVRAVFGWPLARQNWAVVGRARPAAEEWDERYERAADNHRIE